MFSPKCEHVYERDKKKPIYAETNKILSITQTREA